MREGERVTEDHKAGLCQGGQIHIPMHLVHGTPKV